MSKECESCRCNLPNICTTKKYPFCFKHKKLLRIRHNWLRITGHIDYHLRRKWLYSHYGDVVLDWLVMVLIIFVFWIVALV